MGKTIAILQSNYIPWKGYFDIIAAADEFVIFDDVQYTRREWRNRNRIIVNREPQWLTIPVASKGNYFEPINAIRIADRSWAEKHWTTLRHAYGRAPHFRDYEAALAEAYHRAATLELLTDVNQLFLDAVCRFLGLETPFSRSEEVPRRAESPTERLIEICKARGADAYLSGPAARSYIERDHFGVAGIALSYVNYSDYPLYDQGTRAFEHGVSILDVLFRCGAAARKHLKAVQCRDRFLDQA